MFGQNSFFADDLGRARQADTKEAKPYTPSLVRPVPSDKELEDWANDLYGLSLQAGDLRDGRDLQLDIEELEQSVRQYL